jgi:hypothetical protein
LFEIVLEDDARAPMSDDVGVTQRLSPRPRDAGMRFDDVVRRDA